MGRHRCWRIFRNPVNFCPLGAELCLRSIWQHSLDRRDFLRIETGNYGDRSRRSHSDRPQSAQERSHVDARGLRLRRDLLFSCVFSAHYPGCRSDWTNRWENLEREV